MPSFQLVVLAILATRMHLYLWLTDKDMRGSEGIMFIPTSVNTPKISSPGDSYVILHSHRSHILALVTLCTSMYLV